MKCNSEIRKLFRLGASASPGEAFTLIELLVALGVLAVLAPVIYQSLQVASLAGEVSQRKALAARVAEEKLNENIIMGTTTTSPHGSETVGPYQFDWSIKDEPWTALANNLTSLNNPNSVNQGAVTQNIIHQVTVEVKYPAQNRTFAVHLSTLINESLQ